MSLVMGRHLNVRIDKHGNISPLTKQQVRLNPLSANLTKWPDTQTIRRQITDELFERVWPFCEIGA